MRELSPEFLASITDRESEEVALILATITHEELPEPIRIVMNGLEVVSRGQTFRFFPFRIVLPTEREDQPPHAKLEIDGVDRAIVAALRQIQTPPGVKVEIVLDSSPDIVEYETPVMKWKGIGYTVDRVEGILEGPRMFYTRFPKDVQSPTTAPGEFFGGPNI